MSTSIKSKIDLKTFIQAIFGNKISSENSSDISLSNDLKASLKEIEKLENEDGNRTSVILADEKKIRAKAKAIENVEKAEKKAKAPSKAKSKTQNKTKEGQEQEL